jgi:preprotein translocase subunit Sec61beta
MNFLLKASYMSGKRKSTPLPASSAGLLTFFNEETKGIKIKPEIVLISSMALIAMSIIINAFFR